MWKKHSRKNLGSSFLREFWCQARIFQWSIEEGYRFEKQGFGIEKATVRKYSKIKTLLGLTILSWILLVKINESPKLKEVVLNKAKMEKNK